LPDRGHGAPGFRRAGGVGRGGLDALALAGRARLGGPLAGDLVDPAAARSTLAIAQRPEGEAGQRTELLRSESRPGIIEQGAAAVMVTRTNTKLSAVDRDALTCSIALAKEVDEPGRKQQIEYMLEESGWQTTGEFASYGQQMRSLGLKPWEFPPCWVRLDDANPERGAAIALLRRLFDSGLR
jgi:hypothetical protein